MKFQPFQKPLFAVVLVLTFLAASAVAQNSTTASTADTPPANTQPAPPLSYGVSQIVKLSQAKVSDSTIVAYIQNSGNSYGLDANQIIYLRQQGISAGVINTMLSQHNNSSVAATTAPQSTSSDASAGASTAAAQPTVTYVQTVPSTSVYIVPDSRTYWYNTYYYQPYYYPYYAWPYPAVSFYYGWGGGWHGGYHYSGGGGGYHGGGSYHGGGGGWHH